MAVVAEMHIMLVVAEVVMEVKVEMAALNTLIHQLPLLLGPKVLEGSKFLRPMDKELFWAEVGVPDIRMMTWALQAAQEEELLSSNQMTSKQMATNFLQMGLMLRLPGINEMMAKVEGVQVVAY